MSARRAWAAIVFGLLVGTLTGAHGCIDDRAKVKGAIFFCDPTSRTADADCGEGYACYGATQSIGSSICVQRCDPQTASSCDGACTATGHCLTRCKVPADGGADACPSPLVCRRTTISPFEAATGDDGVCLPINASCSVARDCPSPVFDECTSSVTGAAESGGALLTSGEVCVQGKCSARGIACQPGSACIKDMLPSFPVPDVCSPLCGSARTHTSDGRFNECMPGLTCMSDAFPQVDAPACAPGFPGWLCVDDLGCTTGTCERWQDVSDLQFEFRTCSPKCRNDDDCLPFDRNGTPNVLTRNSCHNGYCRNLQSLFFPQTCLHKEDVCQNDPEPADGITCQEVGRPAAAGADMGAAGDGCGQLDPGVMGLGAFGGTALTCTRECTQRSDCTRLSEKLHVLLGCRDTAVGKRCLPMLPMGTACASNADCFDKLTCVDVPGAGKQCAQPCTTEAECVANPLVGSNFACVDGLCTPKVRSGCAAPEAARCLGGVLGSDGNCKSPTGWSCTADAHCQSNACVGKPNGRCQ